MSFQSPMQCIYCWSGENPLLIQHVAANCCCPMPICSQCLRKKSVGNHKIICNGCNKFIRAVQVFESRHFGRRAKKFCESVTNDTQTCCPHCKKTTKVWAKHATPTCLQDTDYCFDCAAGNFCKACKESIAKNGITPFIHPE